MTIDKWRKTTRLLLRHQLRPALRDFVGQSKASEGEAARLQDHKAARQAGKF